MTPEDFIQALVSAASKVGADQKSIIAAIESAGSSYDDAARAYNFIQVAWGRCFLDGMGITFSDKYYCFDGDGELRDSGTLVDQPVYARAESVAEAHKGSPAFELIALSSAEMNSINAALNNGSKPEDLVTSAACVFLEAPTESGVQKVQMTLERELRGSVAPVAQKPWWKFWS